VNAPTSVETAVVFIDSIPHGGADPHAWRIEQHVAALRSCSVDVRVLVVGPLDDATDVFGAPVTYTGLDLRAFFASNSALYGIAVFVGGGTAHRAASALRAEQPHCSVVVDSSALLSIERPRLPDDEVRHDERGGRERIADLRRQRDAELIHQAAHVWVKSRREADHVRTLGIGPRPIVVPPIVVPVGVRRGDRILALASPHREFGEPDLDAVAALRASVLPVVTGEFETAVVTERAVAGWTTSEHSLSFVVRQRALVDHLEGAGVVVIARPHGPTAWAQIVAGRAVGLPVVATPEAVRGVDDPAAWGIQVAAKAHLAHEVGSAMRRPVPDPSLAPTERVIEHLVALGLRPDVLTEPVEWLCGARPSRGRDVARQSYLRHPDDVSDDPVVNLGSDLTRRPLISVLTPVYNTPADVLDETITSVLHQSYENWELILVDDASPDPAAAERCRAAADREDRITFVERDSNGGIAAASNTALDAAHGEFVALLDHDDLLRQDALIELVRAINRFPDVDVLYSDEDKLFESGDFDHTYAKGGWSPDLHLSYNYTCHFACYRRDLLVDVGGWRLGFDGAQDYDLALRVSERTQRIVHIPRTLYHWRVIAGSTSAGVEAKDGAWEAGQTALSEALERRGLEGNVTEGISAGTYHVFYPSTGRPTVGVLIPTRDRVKMLSTVVDDLHDRTSWRDLEVLVVDNESSEPETHEWMAEHDGPIIEYAHQFSYARMMNLAAEQVDADLLLFLNNDVEVVDADWLTTMVGHAQQRRVGGVGARLLFPDGRVQHEGVVLGVGGVAGNVDSRGYFSLGSIERNCLALTGACLMMRPDVFWEVGGFEERLRVAFNDVDLAMRVHQLGYDLVYTPHAELLHQESASRGSLHPEEDEAFFLDRWGPWTSYMDPYYNPRLSIGVQYMFADEVKQIWVPKDHLV